MIYPGLLDSLARIQSHFQADRRCAAIYLWGSLGNGTSDPYSDVDIAIVVDDQEYQAIKSELRALCEMLCGPVLVWLPEGEQPNSCNFAFLFTSGDAVLLYDFYLSSVTDAHKGPGAAPKRVIFDRDGLFGNSLALLSPPAPQANGLRRDISSYWIYMYLNGKYHSRNDIYKMLYVQQVLFQSHLKVLLTMSGLSPAGWWVSDMHRLSGKYQKELKIYFPVPDVQALVRAIEEEVGLFARDAQAACEQNGLEYANDLENGVRRHLLHMGVM